ncbi:MAG: 2-oxoglutarate dehydrogenase complex dihydrolipoyllysine-residue succinyltransferase [Bacteroidales bacterium]|nr:2-oxoglutarate dehydrogenase complex dihydrolipoyllysine-residue succinyltransferase [Bacteroidales bacterium]MCF8333528.1 2-oxoglutarate dehydrogenase complex dihydrolipoyllysine-residue succinyltransferase [Bacteroidales bacterium]
MLVEVKVPSPGESITEVQIANWLVEDGDQVEKDDEIVEIDSDKATLSINAEASGAIKIETPEGETVEVGAVIARIDTEAAGNKKKTAEKEASEATPENASKESSGEKQEVADAEQDKKEKQEEKKPEDTAPATPKDEEQQTASHAEQEEKMEWHVSPLAKKLMEEHDISQEEFIEFFKKYRISRADVEFYLDNKDKINGGGPGKAAESRDVIPGGWQGDRDTERQKMSTLRKKLAQRLVSVKNETAMLTTFNEVDMKPVMDLRKQYKENFKEKHGVSLGFMSFFTKAAAKALALYPSVNGRIENDEIVYHKYADIGIAVSAPKGLMVPVLRNVENMTLAEIESGIKDKARRARDNKITLQEMEGGTFTITNGGVFGSMLSTPIINPPQSAILGMHNIVERPVAIEGKVEVRPVMYVALSYDHRLVDGKDSVSFLYTIKEMLEEPTKLLLGGEDPHKKLLDL